MDRGTWWAAGGMIPGEEAKIPHALWPKKTKQIKNRSSIITNSIKILK